MMQTTTQITKQNSDNGDWLSAQQAVRPDGTVLENLPLVNKKLPPLSAGSDAASPDTPTALSTTTK